MKTITYNTWRYLEMFKAFRRINIIVFLLFVSLLVLSLPAWSVFSSGPYFPLADGAEWYYRDNLSNPYSNEVFPGTTDINGIPTKRLYDSDDFSEYLTNDATNGIRLHGIGFPFGLGTATFTPPIRMVNAMANIGDQLTSVGTVNYDVVGEQFSISYRVTGTVAGEERITVPAGIFNTVRLILNLRLFGYDINGQFIEEASTSTLWLADGVGIVKDYEQSDEGSGTIELVNANLPTVSIDFPTEGATLTRNFEVKFSVSNWTVTPGGNHFHWFLDGVDHGPRYDLSPIPVSGLANGPHTINLRLTNADGSFNGIENSVSFVFERQAGMPWLMLLLD